MKILSTIRKILLHVCVVCSLVSITAKILDWYNPYMDFSGHVGGLQMVLYFVVIVLAVTEGGSFQEENPADMLKKEGCIIIPKDLS